MNFSMIVSNTTKMSLVPFTFKNVELKVVTTNGKPWTRAEEVSELWNTIIKQHMSKSPLQSGKLYSKV